MSYRLSIIIPSYNESKTILSILEKIDKIFELSNNQTQIIVVDDGSSDDSVEKITASRFFNNSYFTLLEHQQNQGKGSAIRTAIPYCQGKYSIIQDADLEYNPQDITKLLNEAEKDNRLAIYGSRNLDKNNQRGKFFFYWGGKLVTWIANLLFNLSLTDEPTGYKLVETQTLKHLPLTCQGFEFCPQLTALLAKNNITITELPISYQPRVKKDGKKIKWRDGPLAIWELLKQRFYTSTNFDVALIISALVFFIYLFTWNGGVMGYEYETTKASLAFLSGKNEIARAGFGAVLLYLPFTIVGKLIFTGQTLNKFLSLVPIFYSALTAGLLYLSFNYLKIKRNRAIILTLLISIGSLMWPYSKIGMEYQAMFLITLIFVNLQSWQKNNSLTKLLVIGTLLAWLSSAKSYGIILGLPILLYILITLRQKKQIRKILHPSLWLRLFGPATIVIIFNLILNQIIFHRLSGPYSLTHEFQIWDWWEGFYGVFFSAGKSIFIYSPLLILSAFYWPKFYNKYKSASVYILTTFILLLLITAPFAYWSDETLSIRKLVPIIPLLHLPLLLFFSDKITKKLRTVILILFSLVAIYIQLINSLYPYWEQLVITRPYNLDRFSVLRYSPQLSHIAINHNLLLSFLSETFWHKKRYFTWSEKSWMRCCSPPKQNDAILTDIHFDTVGMNRPKIYIFNIDNRKYILLRTIIISSGVIILGILLKIKSKK